MCVRIVLTLTLWCACRLSRVLSVCAGRPTGGRGVVGASQSKVLGSTRYAGTYELILLCTYCTFVS